MTNEPSSLLPLLRERAERDDPDGLWEPHVPREALLALLDAVAAADDYRAYTGGHYWRCENRTAAKGWKKGDPPIIECVCGLDRLDDALGRLGLNG